MILFWKAINVSGYTRRDGTFVSPHVRHADTFAERAHAGQYRKGKPGAPRIPYIEHPRAVARILHDEAGIVSHIALQAALLHDTIEDTGVTHADLAREFGREVADVVVELTNDPSVPREGKTAAQIDKARKMSPIAAAVKMADKTANLRDLLNSPPDWEDMRRLQYFHDANSVVGAMRNRHPVLQEMFDKIYQEGVAQI